MPAVHGFARLGRELRLAASVDHLSAAPFFPRPLEQLPRQRRLATADFRAARCFQPPVKKYGISGQKNAQAGY